MNYTHNQAPYSAIKSFAGLIARVTKSRDLIRDGITFSVEDGPRAELAPPGGGGARISHDSYTSVSRLITKIEIV